jgi:hypothetical protein
MSWVIEKFRYEKIAHEIESAVTLKTKDHWFWTGLWVFLVVISFGLYALKMSLRDFLEKWATTIGPIQGYPREYSRLSRRLLVHEARHTWQCIVAALFVPVFGWVPWRRWRAYVGLLPMGLVYGLLPFPVLICYGRYRLELDADISRWRWALENRYGPEEIRSHAARRVNTVGGSAYFYPWPKFLVRRGYTKASERVIKEVGR